MSYKLSITLILIMLGGSSIFSGEPHAYLTALANDVSLPKEMAIKVDLSIDLLRFSFRPKSYAIDSRAQNSYPRGTKEIIGPAENGFIIAVSVGPKGNLPMSRHDGIYTARTIARPYWIERVYGYETPQGTIAISVQQGSQVDTKLLTRVESAINERTSKWKITD